VLKTIRTADRNNLTIAKIFDQIADKHPNKVCFYFEDERWTFKKVKRRF